MYKKDIIYIIIILTLIGFIVRFFYLNDPEYVEDYNAKIEALNQKIDSLHSINDNLRNNLDSLNGEISELDVLLIQSKNTIKIIKRKSDEAIKAASDFTKSELDKFFTDRYRYLFSDSTGDSSERDN